jgi:hypothetical protein
MRIEHRARPRQGVQCCPADEIRKIEAAQKWAGFSASGETWPFLPITDLGVDG